MPVGVRWRCLLGLVAWFAAGAFDPAAAADSQKLAVSQTALHQYQGGPGVPASFEFLPGDTVFFTFRIAGFQTVEQDDDERLHLSYEIEAFDPEGIRLKETSDGLIAVDLAPQDKKNEWTPKVEYEVLVPPSAPSGNYRLAVRVKDELSKATAESEVGYAVRAPALEPSETLVVRNFGFFRSDTARRALEVPAYRPGDAVWARFDMTGYQFEEGNRFHINYGLTVLRASGKELFTEEVAADEARESYYPQRHIPGGLSLNLTPDLPTGDYTIVLTVRDLVGEQIYEIKRVFHVE